MARTTNRQTISDETLENNTSLTEPKDLDLSIYSLQEWYISIQNIKGLTSQTKQVLLLNLMKQENLDIMILTETNFTKEKLKKHLIGLQSKYDIYRTPASKFSKGLGFKIVIILNKDIGKHIYTHNTYNCYGLSLKLSFKGNHYIKIIGIYNSSNSNQNREDRKKLQEWLKQEIKDTNHQDMRTIVGGNFNSITNQKLDCNSPNQNKYKDPYINY